MAPFVSHQKVKVSYFLNGDKLLTKSAKVRKGKGNYGVFVSRIRLRQGGKYAVSARHVANKRLGGDRTVRKDWKVRYVSISYGECGRVVKGFKAALRDMGYIANGGDCFRGKTQRGVLAYRKVNDLSRNLHAGKALVKSVFAGTAATASATPASASTSRSRCRSRSWSSPRATSRSRSTRSRAASPRPRRCSGHFHFYSRPAGYNSEGMYYSRYFYGGYAIHGYASVPTYPASHGCVRTYIADQPEIYERIFIGEDIFVFYRSP